MKKSLMALCLIVILSMTACQGPGDTKDVTDNISNTDIVIQDTQTIQDEKSESDTNITENKDEVDNKIDDTLNNTQANKQDDIEINQGNQPITENTQDTQEEASDTQDPIKDSSTEDNNIGDDTNGNTNGNNDNTPDVVREPDDIQIEPPSTNEATEIRIDDSNIIRNQVDLSTVEIKGPNYINGKISQIDSDTIVLECISSYDEDIKEGDNVIINISSIPEQYRAEFNWLDILGISYDSSSNKSVLNKTMSMQLP